MLAEYEHLKALPYDLKLQLIEELELSLGEKEAAPELSEDTLNEIRRRDAELDADPSMGITREELWRRVNAHAV